MTGLLIKDFLVLRKTLKAYLLFLLFYAALSVLGALPISLVLAFLQLIIMMLPISAFAFDEQAKWDHYAMALPVSRRTVVTSRYMLLLSMFAFSMVVSLLIGVILSFCAPPNFVEQALGVTVTTIALYDTMLIAILSLGFGLIIADFLLPLNYKLGPERSRPYLYAIALCPAIILFSAGRLGLFDHVDFSFFLHLSPSTALALASLLPLIGLVGLYISYQVSCRIVAHKEF